jgi:hypothetical protein
MVRYTQYLLDNMDRMRNEAKMELQDQQEQQQQD